MGSVADVISARAAAYERGLSAIHEAIHGAFYDLDSLAVVPLPAALGLAAVTWRSTSERGDAAAPADEIEMWLAGYPDPLSDAEKQETFANALYHLPYSSRCEHAIDPHERVHRRARPTLRGQAGELVGRIAPA